MSVKRISKTLVYKVAHWSLGVESLEQRLKEALSTRKPKVLQRAEKVPGTSKQKRMINYWMTSNGMLCGEMFSYTEGNNQPIVGISPDADRLEVEQLVPPESKKAGTTNEFIDGTLYFAIKNNHVILAQSNSLKAHQFQSHINWLLGESKLLLPQQMVYIDDQPPQIMANEPLSEVRSIKIVRDLEFEQIAGAPPIPITTANETTDQEPKFGVTKEEYFLPVRPKGSVLEAFLKMIAPGGIDIDAISGMEIAQAIEEGQIVASLALEYKGPAPTTKGLKKGEERKPVKTPMLDDLTNMLSHAEGVEFVAETRRFGTVSSKSFKLDKSITVPSIGTLPRFDSLFEQMAKWLKSLIEAKRVAKEVEP